MVTVGSSQDWVEGTRGCKIGDQDMRSIQDREVRPGGRCKAEWCRRRQFVERVHNHCCVGNSGTGSRGIGSGMECYTRGSGAGLFGDETNGKRAGRWERRRRSGRIPNGAAVGETSARRYQFALLSCDLKQGLIGSSIGFVTAYLCSFFFSIPSEFCPRYSPPLRMAACPS